MQSQNELRNLLQRIDHKSYPAYKDTRGSYDFGNYVLSIDHVQGDPFAAPSKVSVHVRGGAAKFPADLYRMKCRRLAVCDYLLRQFGRELERMSFKAKGSGKSGLLAVSRPGQEVLERTACQMDEAKGDLVLRFEVGFPANGRTVNARELEKIFFTFLPECVSHSLFYKALDEKAVYRAADLAEDQQYIRDHLKEQGLVAFVADASILPRESGVSGRPMKDAVKFTAPESMKVSFVLPHAGKIQGMGIKKGITLIVGGGYHGKSTLLKALELGVYNHIAGDGREYVITDDTAMKIRAEDGRSIKKVDISMFINDLPNGKDTTSFCTEDASGSTSQAANVIEGIEAGTSLFLIDEDTSATNFMIRDELMQRVIHREMEPITPFIERIRELYENYGISTVIVAGSSGAYFHIADSIIQMDRYVPKDITVLAKKEAENFPQISVPEQLAKKPAYDRVPRPDQAFHGNDRIKMKTMGKESVMINRDTIDLRYLEQITDSEQVAALGYCVRYAQKHLIDGKKNLIQIVDELEEVMQNKSLAELCESTSSVSCMAVPRRQEIFACFDRYRALRLV